VQTAVYLLPLRHPVPVARQVASLVALAPGRVNVGGGIGGEDPAEFRACGIDPATRGHRMDEALTVLRPLLAGAEVSMSGDFFRLDRVRIRGRAQGTRRTGLDHSHLRKREPGRGQPVADRHPRGAEGSHHPVPDVRGDRQSGPADHGVQDLLPGRDGAQRAQFTFGINDEIVGWDDVVAAAAAANKAHSTNAAAMQAAAESLTTADAPLWVGPVPIGYSATNHYPVYGPSVWAYVPAGGTLDGSVKPAS
jgi:luciferase-like monooxygenase